MIKVLFSIASLKDMLKSVLSSIVCYFLKFRIIPIWLLLTWTNIWRLHTYIFSIATTVIICFLMKPIIPLCFFIFQKKKKITFPRHFFFLFKLILRFYFIMNSNDKFGLQYSVLTGNFFWYRKTNISHKYLNYFLLLSSLANLGPR